MARKRFNAAEKALITATGNGGAIEWQNVTQWHSGLIADITIREDMGWQYVSGYNLATTPRLSPGVIIITPGHIRAPKE